MTASPSRLASVTGCALAALLPIMGVVFIVFLIIDIAIPVLLLHVREGLGLGTFVVGLVAHRTLLSIGLCVARLFENTSTSVRPNNGDGDTGGTPGVVTRDRASRVMYEASQSFWSVEDVA